MLLLSSKDEIKEYIKNRVRPLVKTWIEQSCDVTVLTSEEYEEYKKQLQNNE